MKIEQFLWKTVVKTGREARHLLSEGRVLIYPETGAEIEIEATEGMEIGPKDRVLVHRGKKAEDRWEHIPHPITVEDL